MSRRRLSIGVQTALALAIPLVLFTGCTADPSAREPETSDAAPPIVATGNADAWVVVIFEDRPEKFDGNLMDALLETEMKADEALAEANAGWIDGNDVGAYGYELYFVGDDAESMWDVLEPIFSDAPVAWTRVELRSGLEDLAPTLITAE
ncbi:hypothetical protein FIV50_09085 [Microbacterium foliorum]|uniref:Uncharacterized protein n=1 Tax=Microbacterium foliorum TaxID=104336 RepID=A0A4Y5YPY1_9MICO|nr:hypothetical protein [Microbacterium foliorum]QDE34930.1 hypothetical protein FIV50_09085 [Microbacterium foliorum]